VFRDLAHELSRQGFAVLRYDNRTWLNRNGSPCGETPMSGQFTTFSSTYYHDALAGLEALQARPEVQPDRVFVVGYGLGASAALQIAAKDGAVDGAVLMAAGARPIDALILERYAQRLSYLEALPPSPVIGVAIEQQEARLAEARNGFPIVRARRWPILELLLDWGKFYWEGYVQETDATERTVRSVRVPLLFVHGEQDFEVPAAELDLFNAWTHPGGTTVIKFPGLTHAFAGVSGGRPETSVSQAVLNRIATWLEEH
jgi:uncharacterized protein